MFGLGMPEILLILAIALMVIGPKKLPELAKTLGRAMGEFKRSAQDFKNSIDMETTVKDLKDIADPKIDLEGIIKNTDTKDDSTPNAESDAKAKDTAENKDEPEDKPKDKEGKSDKDTPKETSDAYDEYKDIKDDIEKDTVEDTDNTQAENISDTNESPDNKSQKNKND